MPYFKYIIGLLSILSLGLSAIILANWLADPFLYNESKVFDYPRREVVYQVSPNIFKAVRLLRADKGQYFFGDSTVDRLDPEYLGLTGADDIVNLAVPSQTLVDTIDAIDFAAELKPINHIYLGVPFRHYSDNLKRKVFLSDAKISDSFFKINTSATSLKATYYGFVYLTTGANLSKFVPPVPEHEFWDYQAGAVKSLLQARTDAEQLRQKLVEAMCNRYTQGIEVTILVPPVYQGLREVILREFGDAYSEYKEWLPKLGNVADYDIDSSFTRDRQNFDDHLHLTKDAAKRVLRDLTSGNPTLARTISGKIDCHLTSKASARKPRLLAAH